jgi:hypothetical protein
MIASFSAEIRTKHVPNASVERYRHASPLDRTQPPTQQVCSNEPGFSRSEHFDKSKESFSPVILSTFPIPSSCSLYVSIHNSNSDKIPRTFKHIHRNHFQFASYEMKFSKKSSTNRSRHQSESPASAGLMFHFHLYPEDSSNMSLRNDGLSLNYTAL